MKKSRILLSALCFVTGIGILFQWILVWLDVFPVPESVAGYRNYFLAFQIADFWLILNALLAGIYCFTKNEKEILFGISLGSAMVFFGLYALLYDYYTKLLFVFTNEELFGKFITFYNIVMGFIFIILFWRRRNLYFASHISSSP